MVGPLVTIAIPTYNRADKFLKKTLERAVNQTYKNIEILVSDNCSTDHTPDIIESFSDIRIKFFRQKENLGAFGNWNFLLKEAKGDYFHMYHDDDAIDPDFIETCVKGAGFRKNLALIMTGSRVIDGNDKVLRENRNMMDGSPVEDLILNWYRGNVNVFFCSTLFGTEILKNTGGFEDKYNHYIDVAAQFKCMSAGKRVDVPDVKASFRKHEGSISSVAKIKDWCEDSTELLNLCISIASSNKIEIKKEGLQRSAKNMYMYSSSAENKKQRLKAFWTVYKYFDYKYLLPLKYCNELIPFSGYLLHPYKAMSTLKKTLSGKFGRKQVVIE